MPPRAKAVRVATLSAATKTHIDDATIAGRASEVYASSQSRYITFAGNRKLTLIQPDGKATLAGVYYYQTLLGLEVPKLYSYETPLIQDKWVQGYSWKKSSSGAEELMASWSPRRLASSISNMHETNIQSRLALSGSPRTGRRWSTIPQLR